MDTRNNDRNPKLASKNVFTTRALVRIAMLSVIAFVLMLLEIPLPLVPPWLKFDLGDLPALIGSFALGPIAGIVIEFLKVALFFVTRGTTSGGVGELASFILGASLVVPAGLVYMRNRTRKGAALGLLTGIIVFSAMGVIANIYILLPFYQTVMPLEVILGMASKANPSIQSLNDIVLMGVLPFNIIKGVLTSAATLILYKYVSPLLRPNK